MKRRIGQAFLFVQFAWVTFAQFGSARWLCWAPNDYAVEYRLDVIKDGQRITGRYNIPDKGLYENPAQNIIDLIEQYERTYGRKDRVEVSLTYRTSGGPESHWHYPVDAN
jgi:hypothetical protein